MGFILPRNPVIRMTSRLFGLFRPLPFLMLSLARRKGVMSRTTMLLVLAAVIGYSANRFDVLENFVPVMKSIGEKVASTANAFDVYLSEGERGPIHAFVWCGTRFLIGFSLIWAALGIPEAYHKRAFPGGFKILAEEKYWRLWVVALVILLLPMEAVARLVCIAIRIVLVPCGFVIRVLNFDLSKLRTGAKPPLPPPSFPAKPPVPEPPQSLRSHWDPAELTTSGLEVTTGGLDVTMTSDSGPTITGGSDSP